MCKRSGWSPYLIYVPRACLCCIFLACVPFPLIEALTQCAPACLQVEAQQRFATSAASGRAEGFFHCLELLKIGENWEQSVAVRAWSALDRGGQALTKAPWFVCLDVMFLQGTNPTAWCRPSAVLRNPYGTKREWMLLWRWWLSRSQLLLPTVSVKYGEVSSLFLPTVLIVRDEWILSPW